MNLPAQGRLGHPELCGRLREIQQFRDGGEIADVSQFHILGNTHKASLR
jgi:hypothetical protein